MPFIVLEGLDGAGKSTQVAKLAGVVAERGRHCEYLHFPRFDAPVYGDLIARFLRGEFGAADSVNPYLVALLFAGDRADAASVLRGWLDRGTVVVTDRYVYSNVAYQCAKVAAGGARDELRDWILDLEFNHNRIPRPDASLFLDVPFSFTESRLSAGREGGDRDYLNGGRDIHEASMELQRNVREVYLRCAARDPMLRIVECGDGEGDMDTPDNIFDRIYEIVKPLL